MPIIEPTLDLETPEIKRPKPYDPLTDPEILRMMGEEPMYDVSYPKVETPLETIPEVDEDTGETITWSMTEGRMTGPSGGAYETKFAADRRASEEETAKLEAEELAKYGPGGYYASDEYAREKKLREAEMKRTPKLAYWTKEDPWSVEASREKYPDWHPLDTMPAWYTERYTDPDAAAYDALTVPEMKIWGIGPGIEDPLSGSEGGLSFKSPDLKRTFSSEDMEKGKIPETPAMVAATSYGIPEGTKWITPEWLTPREGWGPETLYDRPLDAALTDEILRGYRADDPTTRIGPMVIEKKATGVGMVDPPPEYYPTAYPDLAWYTSWGDAERVAGYPASWDYGDVVKDRMKMVADDPIFDPAAPWAEEVTDLDRLVGTFATPYRGEDPREYLEERTDPEYYPLPEFISGMHGPIFFGDDKDWYSKVISDWYGGIESDIYGKDRGYTTKMGETSPEVMALLEDLRFPSMPGVGGAPIEPYTSDDDEALEDVTLIEEMILGGALSKAALLLGKGGMRIFNILKDTTAFKSITSAERAFLKRFGTEARIPVTKSPADYTDITLKTPGIKSISELEAFRRLIPIAADDVTGILGTAAGRLYGASDRFAIDRLKLALKKEMRDHDFDIGFDPTKAISDADYASYITGMVKSRAIGGAPRSYGRVADDAVRKAAGEYFSVKYPALSSVGVIPAVGGGAVAGVGMSAALPFGGATYSMDTKPDFLSSWSTDLPFIGLAGGFESPALRDRMAAAYGYSPTLLGEGYAPGSAAEAAESALTRVIGEGDSEIFSVPDYIPLSDVGSSFTDYVRRYKAPGDARYLTPTKSDITKLWAEDVVRPAFSALTPASGFVSDPISYTYPGADAPWLLPSGLAPTLDFSVEGLFEAATE